MLRTKTALTPTLILLCLLNLSPGSAHAFVLTAAPPANRLVMNLDLSTTLFQTLGYGVQSWSSLAEGALATWNQAGIGTPQDHGFFLKTVPVVLGDPCSRDGVNEVRFASSICGMAWGSSIGITTSWIINGQVVETDVRFNTLILMDAYPGPIVAANPPSQQPLVDFFRLALHEFGHAAGLGHPNAVGQTVVAIMNQGNQSVGNAVDNLQADDIAGAHAILWPPSSLVAAVLPASRSVQVGTPATAFATVINLGPDLATSCGISLATTIPATFTYQTTNPATNALTGTPNTPVNIAASAVQTFVIAFTPTSPFVLTDVQLTFACTNSGPAPRVSGLNTLLLSASTTPIPDIVALSATIGNTGIVTLASVGVFVVATVNVGAPGFITVSADTGAASLPVTIALCETNPATSVCLAPPTPTVQRQMNSGATATFGVFVTGTAPIPFDPANRRIQVHFEGGGGGGGTSVAVCSVPLCP